MAFTKICVHANLSSCDSQFDFSSSSAHQSTKFLADTLQQTKSVVLGECSKEVLDGVGLVLAARVLLKFRNDLRFILFAQRWGFENCL